MDPRHEYTRGLLGAVLSIETRSARLHQIPGTVPTPRDFPRGDRFAPRSSRPDEGLDVTPVLTPVPGSPEHVYAAPAAAAAAAAVLTGGAR
jgi:peptide/nickel transport system permease protein